MKKSSNNIDIYSTLLNEILNLTISPGQIISELEVADRFNVSRTPVREAFRRLQYLELIKIIPHKGTIVSPINLNRLNELLFIREKTELAIVEELLEYVTPYHITQLKLILKCQNQIIDRKDVGFKSKAFECFESDNDFHQLIFKIGRREDVWKLLLTMTPDLHRFRVLCAEFNDINYLKETHNQHRLILECIKSKDMSYAKGLYKSHVFGGMNNLEKFLYERESFFTI